MKNKQLIKFYDTVYKKGERKHHTEFLFGKGKLPPDEEAAIGAISWKGKTVLDVGCGTGLMCSLIAKAGAKEVVGIDYSAKGIAEAKIAHKEKNIEFRAEDLFDHKGTYDIIVSLGTLEHMDKPLQALQRMKKLLASKGKIVVTSPNWTNPRGYMLQTLRFLLDAPITLADLHYLSPIEFQAWAKKLSMKLAWSTFDHNWSQGEKLLKDFARRIPNVMRDIKHPVTEKQTGEFLAWIRGHVLPLRRKEKWNGATGLYIFSNDAK